MTLTRTWLVLVLLTLLALVAGQPGGKAQLGLLGVGLVLLASSFKAILILRNFLGLRHAGGGWQMLLYIYLATIAAGVLGAYALAEAGVLARLR
ncbi:cytochrome C oxidase subunit IV family protein [Roseicella aquatilis]|uniref:Nitric oxide reductase F protein n=1 Tax=Roseicella aquatilis TaxID=2527868 RepID=A0A4R4D393_9PROT|nr:cytochrome C oxidase subunit IV family protein [Roseicella aquatilis]TCZ52780.1 hypothetical protein EXY23_25990 [Roseicella aquatilis]